MNAIETQRLTLEPLTAAHAEEMFAVLGDPAIYEFENVPPASVAALRERYRRRETRSSPDGRERWLNWVVRQRGAELVSRYAVREFTAVLKRANFRSHGLLQCLGFVPAPAGLLVQTGIEADEVMLYFPAAQTE